MTATAKRAPATLEALLAALSDDDGTTRYARHCGLRSSPTESGIDWTELPTYGGAEPADTDGIWSWDATRLLIGTCADDLQIVEREPLEEIDE